MNFTSFRGCDVLVAFLALTGAGCMAKAVPAPMAATRAKAPTAATTPAPNPEIKLGRIDKVGFDAQLAQHAGKVVLVDFWATWCPKCREEFPHTVELDHRHRADGLEVFSFSCDDIAKSDEAL